MPSVSSEIIAEIAAHMGKFGGEQTHGNTCDQNFHFAGMYRDGETANDFICREAYTPASARSVRLHFANDCGSAQAGSAERVAQSLVLERLCGSWLL